MFASFIRSQAYKAKKLSSLSLKIGVTHMLLCLIVDYNQNMPSNECLTFFCFTSYKYYSRHYVLHKLLFRSIVLLQMCLAVFSINKTICSFCSRLSCVFHSE